MEDHLRPFETDPLPFLDAMHRQHGDVVRLRLWPEVCHLVTDPDEVRRILVTDADRYHFVPPPAGGLDGEGSHPAPRFHELVREVLHRGDGVAGMIPAVTDVVERWRPRLDAAADHGEPVDVAPMLLEVMLMIVGRVFLEADLSPSVEPLARAFASAASRGAPHRNISVYQALERRREEPDPDVEDASALISETVRRLVRDRRARPGARDDLLGRIVFDRDTAAPNRLRTDEEVGQAVAVLLVAGHSAPASALAWTMHVLAEHPGVRSPLDRELDEVLDGRTPVAADLPRLRWTRLVLMESMRLFPPVWLLLPRRAAAADRIGGHPVDAGTRVLVSPWLLHRHPGVWARPLDVDPERFASNEPRAYLPFGAGPWGCVGAQFGMVETRVVLAMLSQRYRWSSAPGHAVVLDPQLALWPRDGLWLDLTRRDAP